MAAVHAWPVASLHAPAPSHTLFPEQSGAGLKSGCPAATFVVQVPVVQVLHAAVQASAQQVLSTQYPEAHWPPVPHGCPSASLQPPLPSHALGATQPELGSSAPWATSAVQVPAAVAQEWHGLRHSLSQQVPSTQYPEAHWSAAVHD